MLILSSTIVPLDWYTFLPVIDSLSDLLELGKLGITLYEDSLILVSSNALDLLCHLIFLSDFKI